MSTLILVILAVLTAVCAVSALWFIRWQEQKRLERARQAVEHADTMGELSLIGETLGNWLSADIMKFIAAQIQMHAQVLEEFKIPLDQRCNRALEYAGSWLSKHTPAPARLPTQNKQAQELRNLLQYLIEYIRNEYQARRLKADVARPLLAEARQLNVKIAVAVYEGKATGAEMINNSSQAIHYLKKALTALQAISPQPSDLAAMSEALNERLQEHLATKQSNNAGTRLESATAKLAADDDAWKKKQY